MTSCPRVSCAIGTPGPHPLRLGHIGDLDAPLQRGNMDDWHTVVILAVLACA